MFRSMIVLAYFAPETMLPLTSIAATVAGVGMMLGRGSIRFLLAGVRKILLKKRMARRVNRPHIRVGDRVAARTTR